MEGTEWGIKPHLLSSLLSSKHPRIILSGLISIVEERKKEVPGRGLYDNCEALLNHHFISFYLFSLPKGVCVRERETEIDREKGLRQREKEYLSS